MIRQVGMRRRLSWLRASIATMLSTLSLLSAGSAIAYAAPVLDVYVAANSTNLPGQPLTYLVTIQNVGTSNTDGTPYELSVALPPGLGAVSAIPFNAVGWDCSSLVPGAPSFTCSASDVLEAAIGTASLTVTAAVEQNAAGFQTANFSVAGGGMDGQRQTSSTVRITPTLPQFDVSAFDGGAFADRAGTEFTQAGGTPFAYQTTAEFTSVTHPVNGPTWPLEPFKTVSVELPPGFAGNPTAVGMCKREQIAVVGDPQCPPESQVGLMHIGTTGFPSGGAGPIFNMEPPPDVPARFAVNVAGSVIVFDVKVRTHPEYGVSIVATNTPEIIAIHGFTTTFWGYPASVAHDGERSCPALGPPGPFTPPCPSQLPSRPFLRYPTSCPAPGVGLVTRIHADSWVHPGDVKTASFVSHRGPGYPLPPDHWGPSQGPTGCERVPFDPKIDATPATPIHANEPSGFTFDLTIPQNDDDIGQSDLKKAVVTLPEGVRVSPPSAMGLQGCSSAQIALTSDAKPTCPDASKIGTVTLETPLLEEALTGNVYLATPFDNPSNSLVALYIVVEGPGVIVKLDGRVDLDPDTGQITTTFDDNPQLPFSKLHLELDDGPRAPVVLPQKCGTYTTRVVLTGWSGKTVVSESSFDVSTNSKGQPCKPEFTPEFEAGTISPVAGQHSPFVLNLSRDDEDEELRTLSIDMPQGMLARINGVPKCPAAQAAAGKCGEETRVGTVTTGAGAGSLPFFLDGGVYFSGPYKGAPFSLSIVVPAKAGPFDLGTVVVRAALYVDRRTAAVKVVSDPLPTVLQGIRLQVRDVRVLIDRERFFLNPTSCKEKTIRGTVGSTEGSTAHVSSRFQMVDCASLRLRPRLTLRVGGKGRTRAGASTPLVATLRQGRGQSGLKSVAVQLPLVLNGRLDVIGDACTPEQFEQNAAENCANARAGVAVAKTPLLAKPLRGSAYFVERPSSSGLPNLVVALRGEVDVDLVGTIRIPQPRNTLGTVFKAIPDVPVSSFKLKLFAGENGSVGTTANLCSKRARRATAKVRFVGHNGDRIDQRQRLKIAGCAKKRHR
jgi:hypothetical protein